nr:Domain of unknown function DUF1767 domain containing protein [Haemonchus contortus]
MEEAVLRFLTGLHIHVKEEWIRATVAFLKSRGESNKEDEMCRAVFEQFLYSDLPVAYEPLAKVPSLALRAVIVKPMIFQNMDDLSWFHGEDDGTIMSEPSGSDQRLKSSGPRRLLKMKLSDGQNVVHAIEYGGNLTLDENALPGTKILLTARVLLRKGILLLNPANCQVLGGHNGKPLDLALQFAERLGIKHDVKTNCRIVPDVPSALPLLMKSEGQESKDTRKNSLNVSTISPFLVRIPRIPDQLLHNPETDAQKSDITVKKEICDDERTAVVPPLRILPLSTIPKDEKVEEANQLDSSPRCNVTPPMRKRLLLPLQDSGACSDSCPSGPLEDLPIPSGGLKIIRHEVAQPIQRMHEKPIHLPKNDNAVTIRPVSKYFPVSRQTTRTPPSKFTPENRAQLIHSSPAAPIPKNRSVVDMNENDKLVNIEFHGKSDSRCGQESIYTEKTCHVPAQPDEKLRQLAVVRRLRNGTPDHSLSQTKQARVSLLEKLRSGDITPPVESFRLRPTTETRSDVPLGDPLAVQVRQEKTSSFPHKGITSSRHSRTDLDADFSTTDLVNTVSTQEMLNIPCGETIPAQDPDFLSSIEKSFSKEASTNGHQSPPRSRFSMEPPPTAVVPYKRMRNDEPMQNTVSVVSWPMSKSPQTQKSVMEKFTELKIVRVGESLSQRKFWMLPKRVNVMGFCQIKGELAAKHGSWLLETYLTDESIDSQTCEVDPQLLERLLGFSVKHCEKMNFLKNTRELSRCKERALEVMKSFQRLDLVLTLEIHPQKDKLPVVVDVRTLAEAFDAY